MNREQIAQRAEREWSASRMLQSVCDREAYVEDAVRQAHAEGGARGGDVDELKLVTDEVDQFIEELNRMLVALGGKDDGGTSVPTVVSEALELAKKTNEVAKTGDVERAKSLLEELRKAMELARGAANSSKHARRAGEEWDGSPLLQKVCDRKAYVEDAAREGAAQTDDLGPETGDDLLAQLRALKAENDKLLAQARRLCPPSPTRRRLPSSSRVVNTEDGTRVRRGGWQVGYALVYG